MNKTYIDGRGVRVTEDENGRHEELPKGKAKGGKTREAPYASAMDKIRDEMAASKERYVQVVGEYLTGYLLEHPDAEAAILNSDKTVRGSLKAVEDYARKHKEGSVGIVDDATAFRLVLEYFGVKGDAAAAGTSSDIRSGEPCSPRSPVQTAPQTPAETSPEPDPFDLDALMGGAL